MNLHKLQHLPIRTRKIILWSTIVVIALGMLIWQIGRIKERFETFRGEEFIEELRIPELREELKALPIPKIEITKEGIEELKKLMEEKIEK